MVREQVNTGDEADTGEGECSVGGKKVVNPNSGLEEGGKVSPRGVLTQTGDVAGNL